jgi:hypothetical protein
VTPPAAATPAARSTRTRARRSTAHAAPRRGHATRPSPKAVPNRSRRISGPGKARTATAAAPALGRLPLGRVTSRVAKVLDARLVDRLLRGRGWIGLVGVLLIGLVALQVSMLKLNAGIGASVERASTLERQNARLEATTARLSSADRIRAKARKLGLVPPNVDRNRYVWARPANAKVAAAAIAGGAFVAATPGATGATTPGADPSATGDPAAATDPSSGTYTPDEITTMLNDGDPSNDAQAMLNDGDPSNDAEAMLSDGDPSNDDQALAGSGDGTSAGTG